MGEYVYFDADGPYFGFQAETGVVVGRLATAGLFTFDTEYAGVDHIFVQQHQTETSLTGPYLFRIAFDKDPPVFDAIIEEIREAGFSEVHEDKPGAQDQKVFDEFVTKVFAPKVSNKKIKKWLEDA